MKKLLVALTLALTVGTASAVNAIPIPGSRPTPIQNIDYRRGYNNGYQYGYHNGKSDEREKWERAIVATALISIGAIIIYNAVTGENEKPRDVTHYSYRF